MNFIGKNTTKIPTLIELEADEIDLPKIRLRGSIFFYRPRPVSVRSVNADGKTQTLSYRGNTYQRELPNQSVEVDGKTETFTYRGQNYQRKQSTRSAKIAAQSANRTDRRSSDQRKGQLFSHLTDWELSIFALVIAIFAVNPIPLFPDPQPHHKVDMFHQSQ